MLKIMCELFAGVGGFRLGMDHLGSGWKTAWFVQFEPGAKKQWAHECYVQHFGDAADLNGEYHTGDDIGVVEKTTIPDHTLLVGGFPCQDYSVAHPLGSAQGIEGKKGVLWWQIRDTLIAKEPPFCLLENVDRLLKSPAKQRGRDFGIILACLNELGYSAEWRVVNAAQYGAAQRRRRVFIFAFKNDTAYGAKMGELEPSEIITKSGLMAKAFPVILGAQPQEQPLENDLFAICDHFHFDFRPAGLMRHGVIYTSNVIEKAEDAIPLANILQANADEKYYISDDKMPKWTYLKGAKKVPRKTADGHTYIYSEGAIPFPDPVDKPSRTLLTSEGTLSRTTHVVTDPCTGRLRLLTPVETERLQGFPDGWTNTGMPDRMRYFVMGNALVVPLITRMGRVLDEIIAKEP